MSVRPCSSVVDMSVRPCNLVDMSVLCPEGYMWKFGKEMGKVKKECNVE
jgi:hypothetical protein